MLNRAFQYDLISEKWIECTDENFINADIENIPTTLIINYFDLNNYVYCTKHHNLEKIIYEDDIGIISGNGCKFKDSDRQNNKKFFYCPVHKRFEEIILIYDNEIITDTFCKFYGLMAIASNLKSPIRWRIFQDFDRGLVNIAVDLIDISYKSSGIKKFFDYAFISISFPKKIAIVDKMEVEKNRHSFGENIKIFDWKVAYTHFKIPEIVEEAAMETLRDSTKAIYRIKPTVITKFKGVEKICAYVERPFDLNIILLKNFFADFGDFDKIFPYDCTDNYKIICRLLEINPPKSLRKAYAKNPYAIVWYMIFKQLEVKDINFMQKFFLLDECITVMPLNEFCFCRKDKQIVKMRYSDRWRALQHFCKYLIKERSERFMMNWLYKFSTKENLTQNQIDTFEMFYKYEENISAEIKTKLFKNGLTWYIHDAMSAEVADYLQKRDNVKIFYDEKVLNCEGNINGYDFKVVKETKDLYYVGLKLANCVATYRNSVLNLYSIIFVVAKNDELVACIEICDGEIVQALGYHNQNLNDEISEAVREWQKSKVIVQMKDATAKFFQNEVEKSFSPPPPKIETGGRDDMISQAEIDALLRGY